MLVGPARCGTPVPQPLSVMNNVKAKGEKGFMAGEGMSGVKSKGFFAPSFLTLMSFGMIVSIGMGCYFGGKGFYRLGFWPINVDFTTSKGLLVHSQEFPIRDLVCVFVSDLFLIPAVIFPEKRKDMSSSDSVSLSTSSSESIESRRSRGRHVEEESTSSGGMVGRITMEMVTEVREDPPEELAESNWLAKGGYGWMAADVRNQSSLFQWSRMLNS